jgi:hypothetical protein
VRKAVDYLCRGARHVERGSDDRAALNWIRYFEDVSENENDQDFTSTIMIQSRRKDTREREPEVSEKKESREAI